MAGRRCAACGYARCEEVLNFHHVDPETKSFSLTFAASKARETYLAEFEKCALVCANCHGEIETGLIECPPAGTRFGELGTAGAERRAA